MFIIENLLDTLRQILLKSVMLRHVTSHIDNFTASIVRVMMVSDFLEYLRESSRILRVYKIIFSYVAQQSSQ